MPNHVTNILRVSGDPEKVRAMFEAVKDDEIGLGSLDFNKVIPKPEALDIEWGSRSHRAMKLYKAFVEESTMLATMNVLSPQPDAVYSKQVAELLTKYEKLTQDDPELFSLGEQCYNNIRDYGHPSWYDWSLANWGTKWNSYGYHDYTAKDFNGGSVEFQTAWSYPDPIIDALAARYPDLSFEVKWADEDFGYNVGHKEFENGEELFSHIPPGGSKEALEMAAEIHELDLADEGYLLNEKTGEYEYHNPDESMSLKM